MHPSLCVGIRGAELGISVLRVHIWEDRDVSQNRRHSISHAVEARAGALRPPCPGAAAMDNRDRRLEMQQGTRI